MSDQELAKLFSENVERRLKVEQNFPVDETAEKIRPAVELSALLEQADFSRGSQFRETLRKKLLSQVSQKDQAVKRKKNDVTRPWFSAFQTAGGIGALVLLVLGLSWLFGNVRFLTGGPIWPGGPARLASPTAQVVKPNLANAATATQTAAATRLPLLARTALPTVTPGQPQFSKDAPWLIVQTGLGFSYYRVGAAHWASYNNPDHDYILDIGTYNGGDWIAIHYSKDGITQTGQYLEWMHLTDGQIIPIARLDSDWPEPRDDQAISALGAVTRGRVFWSPDGHALAFQAAKYGDENTDIYIARTDRSGIIRLTRQALNAEILAWTPDGQEIIYAENHACDSSGCKTDSVWSVSLDGNAKKLYVAPKGTGETVLGFTSPTQLIVYTKNDTWAMRLRQVDLTTGLTAMIYSGYFYSAAVDPSAGKVLFNALQPGFDESYYLVTRPDKMLRLNLAPSQTRIRWLPEIGQFLLGADGSQINGIVLIKPDGTMTSFPNENSLPSASPDQHYLVFQDQTTRIYDLSGNLLRTNSTPGAADLAWSIDSKGFFYIANQVLYYQDVSKGEPEPVGPRIPVDLTGEKIWVY